MNCRLHLHSSSPPPLCVKSALSAVTDPKSMSAAGATVPEWAQKTITLTRHSCGCYLVPRQILREIQEESQFKCGLAHFFLHHTSASLTINENYDSDVLEDTRGLEFLSPSK